jgi:uncharacterized protein YdcH (DUF465 family)
MRTRSGNDDARSRLEAEHLAMENRLAELRRRRSLTSEEQAEEQRLKKLKLATKDRLARMPES